MLDQLEVDHVNKNQDFMQPEDRRFQPPLAPEAFASEQAVHEGVE